MLRFAFLLVAAALAIATCSAGYVYGRTIPFAAQWPLYEALRNTASIIFAVVGAWLAIVYPDRFRFTLGGGNEKKPAPSKSMGLLLLPAVHSTILLVLLLLAGVVAPLVKQVGFAQANLEMFRGLSYAAVCFLTWWQIVIVVMTLFPAEALQTQVSKEDALRAIDDQHTKLRPRRS